MTNEEAIASLKHMRGYKIADKEAMDMAITALEFNCKRMCMNCAVYVPYRETEGACCDTHHLVMNNFFCKWWKEKPTKGR